MHPAKAKAGETVTIRTHVTAQHAASDVNVDLEVKDGNNQIVAQRVFTDQRFSAGQTRAYEWKWQIPPDLAGGEYTAKVGVFAQDFGRPVAWNNEAGRIRIEGGREPGAARRAAGDRFEIEDTAIHPRRVRAGQSARIETTIRAREPADAVHVDLEVKDQGNNKVAHRIFRDQRFADGQARTYEWNWTAPDDLPPGDYTVKVGVFDRDWKEIAAWDNDAAEIKLRRPSR
jgi:hypothetical protein